MTSIHNHAQYVGKMITKTIFSRVMDVVWNITCIVWIWKAYLWVTGFVKLVQPNELLKASAQPDLTNDHITLLIGVHEVSEEG